MKITFLTRRNDHKITDPLITVLSPEDYSFDRFRKNDITWNLKDTIEYNGWYVIAHDIETSKEFPCKEGLLLSAFCMDAGDHVLVIDNTSVDNDEIFTPEILKRCLFIAHNADFEARWGVATNFLPMRYACTMVNHKRLLAGQDGYRNDIISVINYYLGYQAIPEWMDKDIRSEFSACPHFEDRHILYNASDTIRLKDVYYKQLEKAAKIGQSFMLKSINSRIIIPIAKAEQLGIRHDTEKWLGIAKDREIKANAICQELTRQLVSEYSVNLETVNPALKKEREAKENKLSKLQIRIIKLKRSLQILNEKGKAHLKSYLLSTQQLKLCETTLEELSQGAKTQTVKGEDPVYSAEVNWGSSKQVLTAFREMQCPIPTAKDKKSHGMKEGVGKEARTNWFVANEDSLFMPFMKKFDSFKKLQHNIKSFGESWVNQYVRDGRAFTSLDQAGTATGRFSSGSKGIKHKRYYNGQQIPVKGDDKIYRTCFIADDGRSLGTLDYANCEGAIMTSLARDLNMMKILQMKDSHSYLGTKVWRAIYADRYAKTGDAKWGFLAENYLMENNTPEGKKARDIFKNSCGLFPVSYGVSANKVAATSRINEREGQIAIDVIKKEIPDVTILLEGKAEQAVKYGYVHHNDRTNSRRYFTQALDAEHYHWKLNKEDKATIEFAARNSPIQGTNSDLIKEAIAYIEIYTNLFKQDIRFLNTIHDEIVVDVPEDKEPLVDKVKQLMVRAANNYLIPEVVMGVDERVAKYWKK